MDVIYSNAWLKARILAGRTVIFNENVPQSIRSKYNSENHHYDEWIFIRLNENSRVRLVIDENSPAFSINYIDSIGLLLIDNKNEEILIKGFEIEEAVIHAPDQLFLGVYEYCRIGCKFCPLHINHGEKIHYSLDSIYKDIDMSKKKGFSSIGITTSIPYSLSSNDVADEMIFLVRKIREKVDPSIPIGASTRIPSESAMKQLYAAGASEIRLNIEVPNQILSKELMPNKSLEEIYQCIDVACRIFGRGKVSSNIVLGLGESDQDVIDAVRCLAEIGAIATLYPFDPFDSSNLISNEFIRPKADRLYRLAVAHKKILDEYKLDPLSLKTMCPSCAASHIFPGRDL